MTLEESFDEFGGDPDKFAKKLAYLFENEYGDGDIDIPDDEWSGVAKYLNDMVYEEEIINGHIYDWWTILDQIRIYTKYNVQVRVRFLAYIMNTYYKKEFEIALQEKIDIEDYETVILYKELMKITEMPLTRI